MKGQTARGGNTVWNIFENNNGEESSNVKKIVVLNGHSEQDELLMACLRWLFPECDIQVQSKEMKNAEEVHTVSELTSSKSHY